MVDRNSFIFEFFGHFTLREIQKGKIYTRWPFESGLLEDEISFLFVDLKQNLNVKERKIQFFGL